MSSSSSSTSSVTLSPKPTGAWTTPLEPDELNATFTFRRSSLTTEGNAWWICCGEWYDGRKYTSASYKTKNEAKRAVMVQLKASHPPPPVPRKPSPIQQQQQPVIVYEAAPTKDQIVLLNTLDTAPLQACRGCGIYTTCMGCSACKSPLCNVAPMYCALFHIGQDKCKGVPPPLPPSPEAVQSSRSSSYTDVVPFSPGIYYHQPSPSTPLLPFSY